MQVVEKPKILEGYIKKQGEKGIINTFKERYFKQVKDKWFYFLDKESIKKSLPLGYIDMNIILKAFETTKGFDVVTPNRVYHFQTVEGGKNAQIW